MAIRACHACSREVPRDLQVSRKEVCAGCGRDLRCCRNCRFYDRNAPKQCREPVAEQVRDKDKATFCDYFEFREQSAAGKPDAADQARKSLDALFGK